ncbi:MAG: Na/Pi cotransporter family protein, partial [Clostridia bacterium]|nr:Na/Pi cotransporter family protein [Clostridia bacterium]
MPYVYAVCGILAGLGVFLFAVKLLQDNMERLANKGIRDLFKKTNDNAFVGVGIGLSVTALVQSSGLTTVMVVGFVNAGIMTLYQATAIIMGANIGTTVTAQIAALQAFSFSDIAVAVCGIGIFMVMFAKKEKVRSIGNILGGLGMIFVGLQIMSDSMSIVKESQMVVDLLASISNPLLLLVIGVVFTALVQSSSAITSILISMASAGLVIGGG